MPEQCEIKANATGKNASAEGNNVDDIYFCVFFDGTSNNCWEQENKKKKMTEKLKSIFTQKDSINICPVLFTPKPSLFQTNDEIKSKLNERKKEWVETGMFDYELQKEQAEREININEAKEDGKRGSQKDINDNSGWKYSNVALLRSMLRLHRAETTGKTKENYKNKSRDKVGLRYNLYIEGAGAKWDKGYSIKGSEIVGLGMGTGRTGVVGLVSKAMVFVYRYLESLVLDKDKVNLHFAVFGFSRGSTCGRLFSYLIAAENSINDLPKKKEFKDFLPQNRLTGKDDIDIDMLKDYKHKTVDFLGIYDTVSSIGFLHKDRNIAYVPNNFTDKTYAKGSDEREINGSINKLHDSFDLTTSMKDAQNNFHRDNVTNYGLYSPTLSKVKHTFHICAMDEYRENFALVDLGCKLCHRCTEVFMPGCHSDIGGGIMFDDDIERMTLRRKIEGINTKMIKRLQPLEETDDFISQQTLNNLGWLNKTAPTITQYMTVGYNMIPVKKYEVGEFNKEKIKKRTTTSEGLTAYIYQDDEKIEFEHFAQEGYSNVTLKMMRDRTMGEKGLKCLWPKKFLPFSNSKDLPSRFKPKEFNGVTNKCYNDFKEGKRHWIVPTDNEYRELRSNYLHFSCTDELNVEKLNITQSLANIGNPPYWLKKPDKVPNPDYYLLCRLVYHGDKDQNELHNITEYSGNNSDTEKKNSR